MRHFNSQGTRTLEALKILKAIGHSKGTSSLGHSSDLGTWALETLRHLKGTWELGHSRHLGTQGTWALGLSGTCALGHSKDTGALGHSRHSMHFV